MNITCFDFLLIVVDRQSVWFWLGGSDEEVTGTWRWYNDHSKFNYTNWYPTQPNEGLQHCLCLWGPNNFTKWDDHYCYMTAHYICEKRYNSFFEKNISALTLFKMIFSDI